MNEEEIFKSVNSIREILLRKVEENEYKIDEYNKKLKESLDVKYINLEKIISSFSMQLEQLQQGIVSDKQKIEKIAELTKFKDYTEDFINNYKDKIGLVQMDLNNACYKYDKILTDNLDVPGIIGEYNRFKTMREFIEVIKFENKQLCSYIYLKLKTNLT